jgi:hypothetical protein
MAEHESAQATTSKSPSKALWLATLDALEQECLAFQKRGGARRDPAQADVEAPRSAPEQLGPHPRVGS